MTLNTIAMMQFSHKSRTTKSSLKVVFCEIVLLVYSYIDSESQWYGGRSTFPTSYKLKGDCWSRSHAGLCSLRCHPFTGKNNKHWIIIRAKKTTSYLSPRSSEFSAGLNWEKSSRWEINNMNKHQSLFFSSFWRWFMEKQASNLPNSTSPSSVTTGSLFEHLQKQHGSTLFTCNNRIILSD